MSESRRARWTAAPLCGLLAVVLAAAAGGCGGDDEGDEGAADEAAIAEADAEGQAQARTLQTAIETYFVDQASYAGATEEELVKIEPTAEGVDFDVEASEESYTITVPSAEGSNSFSIEREPTGEVPRTCTEPGEGACGPDGTW